ncbi:hypothetical protein GJR88_02197 [Dietzia sp. DQ12-45-1b]|nr:hypothetical protein GJR88_02197 [Dietzia sp. DQ12-45-1b]
MAPAARERPEGAPDRVDDTREGGMARARARAHLDWFAAVGRLLDVP